MPARQRLRGPHHRVRNANEIPEQINRPRLALPGRPDHDRHSQMVEFLHLRLALLQIDEGARAADGLDPLVDLGGELARLLGAGELHAELLAQDRIGRGVHHQHLGQRLGAKSSQGCLYDGFRAGH